jgi:cell wall-associated NlpC family hydrolase
MPVPGTRPEWVTRRCSIASSRVSLMSILLSGSLTVGLGRGTSGDSHGIIDTQPENPVMAAVAGPGDPAPPTRADMDAAAATVSARAAELQRQQDRLGAASARLEALRVQAEAMVERYDWAAAAEQRATTAYRAAQARLARATAARQAADAAVASQAAADYEEAGGAGQLATLLGDPRGSRSYLDVMGLEQLLAQHQEEVLANRQAADNAARVIAGQARDLLVARQADARVALDLRQAVQALVAGQLAAVENGRSRRDALAGALAAARARQDALKSAAQAAAAAAAAGESGAGREARAGSANLASGASVSQGEAAANWAMSQLGKPYQWGAAGPDTYDCSGLAMQAWARAGVHLGHFTGVQWGSGPHVPLNQLHRGDLLFYASNTADPATIHHVGIYIGKGMMVNAPYTGAPVRIDSMYGGGLIGATRPAG